MEAVNIIVYAFVTFALEIGGRFHVPAALSPGEKPVPNEQVAGWALEPVLNGAGEEKNLMHPSGMEPYSHYL
jgi:hypothetical protein